MNKMTAEIFFNLKVILEVKKLIKEYKKDNPGIDQWTDPVNEFIDSEIIRNLNDIKYTEKL